MNQPPNDTPLPQITWQKVRGVVLIADLENFFPLARKTPLDDLSGVLQAFFGICSNEICRQKGEIASFIGDTILAFFEQSKCAGMDPEWCATRTAFHLIKMLKKIKPDLDLNIGMYSGDLLDGRVEEQGRMLRLLNGDVVNRAAVLAGKMRGIHVSRQIVQILGPRVSHEKAAVRFPGSTEEEVIFKLVSLVL